jgi:hypothetical protein
MRLLAAFSISPETGKKARILHKRIRDEDALEAASGYPGGKRHIYIYKPRMSPFASGSAASSG